VSRANKKHHEIIRKKGFTNPSALHFLFGTVSLGIKITSAILHPLGYLHEPALELNSFRRQLKTFLFARYWAQRTVRDIMTIRYINLLFTYLLTYLLIKDAAPKYSVFDATMNHYYKRWPYHAGFNMN